jgi:hypothetical protein
VIPEDTPTNIGNVLSIINTVPVVFHALSVTMNVCNHSLDIIVPLVYAEPSNVAHERFASLNVMASFHE